MNEAIASADEWLMSDDRGPFAKGADAYAAAGWTGVIPVQKSTKLPDMSGVTGREGAQTTPENYTSQAWHRYRNHNVGIRLANGIIGLDVDQYDGKHGAEQMHELEQQLGELPKTWSSTSRGKGPSRIMFFQVPADCGELKGNATPDTEVIQHHHRYAIVWPSMHQRGGQYTWYSPDGEPSERVPQMDEFPFLPQRWMMHLEKPQRQNGTGAGLDVETFTEAFTAEGDPQLVDRLREKFESREGCRHDTMLKALGWSMRAASQGKVNAEGMIDVLFEDWESATGGGRENEFWDLVRTAVADTPEPEEDDDPNDFGLPTATVPKTDAPAQDSAPAEKPLPSWMTPDIQKLWDKPNVREEAKKQYERAQAKQIVEAIRASETVVELPGVLTLTDLLARPEEGPQWRIAGLLPAGGRVVMAAARKAGKTTTVVNLVRALADAVVPEQDPFASMHSSDNPFAGLVNGFLGSAKVYDVEGRIAIVDNEMSEGQLQRWYKDAGIKHPERVDLYALRGKGASFNILDASVRAQWAKRLEGVSFLILDCLAPFLGALGLAESNEDVSKFLSAVDALLEEAGIPDAVLVHHMGHGDERSRGASRLRDWPDVEWKLVREKDSNGIEIDDGARFFSAYGRDVDVRETQLTFDLNTRRLSLGSVNRVQYKVAKYEQPLIEYIRANPGLTQNKIRDKVVPGQCTKSQFESTVKFLRASGKVHTHPAARGALMHFICDDVKCPDSEHCMKGNEKGDCPDCPALSQ